jgi:hypothetical protein
MTLIILYREEIAQAAAALPPDSAAALHFKYLLMKMEEKELQAVAVVEHG